MAGFATHAIFGKQILQENGSVMPSAIVRRHLGVFGVGCQGPDLFLYNIPMLCSGPEKNLGIRMHNEKTSRHFAYLIQEIWETSNVWEMEIGLSYLYGALAHYTLDSMVHPYVYARIGLDPSNPNSKKKTEGLHHRLESAIDAKMIVVKENILPSAYCAAKSQKMTKQEKNALASFLSGAISKSYQIGLKKENVLASFWMMRVITAGFFSETDRQRKIFQKLERPFFEDYIFSNFMVTDHLIQEHGVMNSENRIWHNPWNKENASDDSVWEIYDKALIRYREYCILLKEALPLYRGRFFAIMGEDMDWKKIRKRIRHVAKRLGNHSYDTGMPCFR